MVIQDPIYSFVKPNKQCTAFIDTPEMQRLKRIKQLGMTYQVFPSGTHTRFEHSLGVMHLSGVFFDNLLNNSDNKWKVYNKYKPLVQLAGLLHDIGHGPFSHVFEETMGIIGVQFKHEDESRLMVNRINNNMSPEYKLNEEEEMLVQNIISGVIVEGYPPFLFQIVTNKESGLDTDKMDYLRRDSKHLGMSEINPDYIINHCRIDNLGNVCYAVKAEQEILTLFKERKKMYEKVYYHKTVVKIDKIMICALSQLEIDTDDPDCYFKLDDGYVETIIRHKIKHDVVRCLDRRTFDHTCDKCPGVRLKRVAKLSGDTNDPMAKIRWYDE